MSTPLRVIQIGLGPVGRMLTPYLMERKGLEVVGAVDIDPRIVGRRLVDLAGLPHESDVAVSDDLDAVIAQGADAAVITTVSGIEALGPVLEPALAGGLNVVSTCEELSYPWKTQPALSQRIDRLGRENGVSVLGTGINPGFLMDSLPAMSTAVCRSVDSIFIERIQDASHRRLPFRLKIGAGLSLDEFRERARDGKIRHVGLTESMHMVAARLGWDLDRTEDVVEPILAEQEIHGDGWTVSAGATTGVSQTGRGFAGGEQVLTLVFKASLNEGRPRDRIVVNGAPQIDLTIAGGVNGDVGTCSVVTNVIPLVVRAVSGLRTMLDIPPVCCFD